MASGSRVLGLNNNSIDRNLGGLASDNAPYSSRREKSEIFKLSVSVDEMFLKVFGSIRMQRGVECSLHELNYLPSRDE